jgi:hypothetical protein
VQHGHASFAQRWGGEPVHRAVADDDPTPGGQITAAVHQLRDSRLDGGPPRRRGQVVDRPAGRVDQPEPVGLEPPQHRRLVVQVDVRPLPVQGLRERSVQVVAAQVGCVEEAARAGSRVGWGLADQQDSQPVRPVLLAELLIPGRHAAPPGQLDGPGRMGQAMTPRRWAGSTRTTALPAKARALVVRDVDR